MKFESEDLFNSFFDISCLRSCARGGGQGVIRRTSLRLASHPGPASARLISFILFTVQGAICNNQIQSLVFYSLFNGLTFTHHRAAGQLRNSGCSALPGLIQRRRLLICNSDCYIEALDCRKKP